MPDHTPDTAARIPPTVDNPPQPGCGELNRRQGAQRPEQLRELCGGSYAPGVVAYHGDEPIGWCAFGPWTDMGRLQRSQTIPRVDERPRWSIVCFVVRARYRRQGVGGALLAGAIHYAADCGVELLEAYPVETDGQRLNSSFAYVGTTSMFERAGFRRIQQTAARTAGRPRWVMRLEPVGDAGSQAPHPEG